MARAASAATAHSLYRGLRVTITQLPDGGATLVTVAAKGPRQRWDEWSLLYPAVRMGALEVHSHMEALEAIQTAVGQLLASG